MEQDREQESQGRQVALVLGAGGARGLAHIGVIELLLERGYRPTAIVGSSMGALVGGIYASGRLAEYRQWACALQRSDVLRLLDFSFGHPGLIRGERVIGALRELVGEHRIEDLPIPFVAVATDLAMQRELWLTRGALFEAIRASIAIPMVFTPHVLDGRELVDGGLLAPIPITATRMFSTELVIAVDASAGIEMASMGESVEPGEATPEAVPQDSLAPANGMHAKIEAFIERMLERRKPEPRQPGLMELMSRSLDTVHARISQMQLALDPPDVLVRIPHDACYFYEFWRTEEMIRIGRRAAARALDAWEHSHASRGGR